MVAEPNTLPSRMLHIKVNKPGGAQELQLTESPLPQVKANDVLIRVSTAGVNRPDIVQRQGHYPPPPGASTILGLEVSGEVVACGANVTHWKKGDKVCALTNGGGYAQYVAVPASQCLPIPQGVSLEEAASLPETYFTVWSNLFNDDRLTKGQRLLVHGGTSGIGSTAIQLAKAKGCEVYTTVGSAAKLNFCKQLHADLVINYKEEDFVERILSHTGQEGVDVILDMVGGPYVEKHMKLARAEGKIISIAFLQGAKVNINLMPMMLKRLTLTGATLRSRSTAFKAHIAQALLTQVWPLFETQQLQIVVDSQYELKNAAEAHKRMESSQHQGKILLKVPH